MKKRVLAIDDEPHILELIIDILAGYDCEIKTANNGLEALKRIDSDQYDIIISDIKMPVMGGVEFYKELINRSSSMKDRIIFITCHMDEDVEVFIKEEGIKGLSKPFKVDDLIKAVDDVAEQKLVV